MKRSAEKVILSSDASDAKQCRFSDSDSYEPREVDLVINTNDHLHAESSSYDHNTDNNSRGSDYHDQSHNN